jgi:4-hydroxy-tetrahydrodipicolinate reductase
MKIALLGYGKMGKELEQVALERNHRIVLRVDVDTVSSLKDSELQAADVALEFTAPASAFENILRCIQAGVPVVCGTTGWTERLDEIKKICKEKNGAVFYAPNFSIGVNIFFEINRRLAELMKNHTNYEPEIEEIHHIHKKDKPSGTAIALAETIIAAEGKKTGWKLKDSKNISAEKEITITSVRENEVPGIHSVKYLSQDDELELIHRAKGRRAFASGAILAAEWLQGKKGFFGMKDMM